MDSVRVNDIGQINLTSDILQKYGVKSGMEFFVFKRNGEFILRPTPLQSLEAIQKICEGKASEVGWKSEDDVIEYMKELRKESYIYDTNNG